MVQVFRDANGGADSTGVRATGHGSIEALTDHWGDRESVCSYLGRCSVDTPAKLVAATWERVDLFRPEGVGKVVDLGAGDGRFALHGRYRSYVGYEIDEGRSAGASLPEKARLLTRCAFADGESDADVCIGNPPFVRNQQMPERWLREVREVVRRRTGVVPSGLANAWQYFFLNALARLRAMGWPRWWCRSSGCGGHRRRLCAITSVNSNGTCTCTGFRMVSSRVCLQRRPYP